MRLKWVLVIAAVLAATLLAAMACGDDDDDVNVIVNDDNATATRAAATSTRAAVTGGAEEFSAIVAGGEDISIGGTVVIAEGGDGVEVVVDLIGLPEGAHANHLHHGTCEEQGVVHVTLTELEADADGIASGVTTFADPPLQHFATGHYYAVHDGAGAVIGCGNVE